MSHFIEPGDPTLYLFLWFEAISSETTHRKWLTEELKRPDPLQQILLLLNVVIESTIAFNTHHVVECSVSISRAFFLISSFKLKNY